MIRYASAGQGPSSRTPGRRCRPISSINVQDLGLSAAEQQRATAGTKATSDHRQIEHHGGVREHEFAEIDDDVRLGPERAHECLAPRALGGPVLVPTTPKDRRLVIEVDDRANLAKPQGS